jgi:hypothetical protein
VELPVGVRLLDPLPVDPGEPPHAGPRQRLGDDAFEPPEEGGPTLTVDRAPEEEDGEDASPVTPEQQAAADLGKAEARKLTEGQRVMARGKPATIVKLQGENNSIVIVQFDGGGKEIVKASEITPVEGQLPLDTPKVDAAANAAASSPKNELPHPTKLQIAAGNPKLGHWTLRGLRISFENASGSWRWNYPGFDSYARMARHEMADPDRRRTPLLNAERLFKEGNPGLAVEQVKLAAAAALKDGAAGFAHGLRKMLDEGWHTKLRDHYGYIRGYESRDGDKLDVFVRPGTPDDYNGPVFVIDQKKLGNGHFDEHKVMIGWPTEGAARIGYLRNYQPGWKGERAVTGFASVEAFKDWLKTADLTQTAESQAPVAPERWESYEIVAAPQEGRYLVREAAARGFQNLATFAVKDGKAVKIEHFFQAEETRGPVMKAIERWVAAGAKLESEGGDDAQLTVTQGGNRPGDRKPGTAGGSDSGQMGLGLEGSNPGDGEGGNAAAGTQGASGNGEDVSGGLEGGGGEQPSDGLGTDAGVRNQPRPPRPVVQPSNY